MDRSLIEDAIKQKYAWPGGHPLYLVTKDFCALCIDCARKDVIIEEVRTVGTNWEDPYLYCDRCNQRIESAYAEDGREPD